MPGFSEILPGESTFWKFLVFRRSMSYIAERQETKSRKPTAHHLFENTFWKSGVGQNVRFHDWRQLCTSGKSVHRPVPGFSETVPGESAFWKFVIFRRSMSYIAERSETKWHDITAHRFLENILWKPGVCRTVIYICVKTSANREETRICEISVGGRYVCRAFSERNPL